MDLEEYGGNLRQVVKKQLYGLLPYNCFLGSNHRKKMPSPRILFGIIVILLSACGNNVSKVPPSPASLQANTPSPTLTAGEQRILADLETQYSVSIDPKFYFERSDCIRAVDNGTTQHCVFIDKIEHITKTTWEKLFPVTFFYLVDLHGWRSNENLLPNETQDSGVTRFLAAWQNEQTYYIQDFDRLLEDNAIVVNDTNREVVAQAFALMSIPSHLRGDVRFLEWKPIEPGVYRHNYSHLLKGWTEIWGCEVLWAFVFDKEQITIVTLQSNSCYNKSYGNYLKDMSFVNTDSEGTLTNVAPHPQDFYVASHSGMH